jgi:hypothetical protein
MAAAALVHSAPRRPLSGKMTRGWTDSRRIWQSSMVTGTDPERSDARSRRSEPLRTAGPARAGWAWCTRQGDEGYRVRFRPSFERRFLGDIQIRGLSQRQRWAGMRSWVVFVDLGYSASYYERGVMYSLTFDGHDRTQMDKCPLKLIPLVVI